MKSFNGCRTITVLAAVFLCSDLIHSEEKSPTLRHYEHAVMGTIFQVKVDAGESDPDEVVERAFARADALNAIFSDYEAESELLRLCREPAGQRVPISPELYEILEISQALSRESEGAFDVTIGPLTRLWKLTKRDAALPAKGKLRAARSLTGWQMLELHDDGSASLEKDRMRLNLGGIAKGKAADEMLRILREGGFPRSLVAASGDIVAGDAPTGTAGWKVGLAGVPEAETGKQSQTLLSNRAVSTSGDLEQVITIDGKRYSHIVDPRTGLGVIHQRLVTVIAPDATTTDSLATALSVMDVEAGMDLVESKEGVEACIHSLWGAEYSSGFPRS